jgi:DNA-directed RNA polymerase subunit beta
LIGKTTGQITEDTSQLLLGEKIPLGILLASTGEVIIAADREIGERMIRKIVEHRTDLDMDPSLLRNHPRKLLQLGKP